MNWRQIAPPIPPAAPVTMAILLSSRAIFCSCPSGFGFVSARTIL
jgi:hypothetical protein